MAITIRHHKIRYSIPLIVYSWSKRSENVLPISQQWHRYVARNQSVAEALVAHTRTSPRKFDVFMLQQKSTVLVCSEKPVSDVTHAERALRGHVVSDLWQVVLLHSDNSAMHWCQCWRGNTSKEPVAVVKAKQHECRNNTLTVTPRPGVVDAQKADGADGKNTSVIDETCSGTETFIAPRSRTTITGFTEQLFTVIQPAWSTGWQRFVAEPN